MTRSLHYIPQIDGIRAIAVMSVVLFHLGVTWTPGGFVGVDVFFVISGFLITRLIRQECTESRFSFSVFYVRRARRLFPALFFTLIAALVGGIILFSPSHLERLGGSLLHALLSVSNFYFWSEADYFDTSVRVKPLVHTWSLAVEEQFYMVWPLIVFLLAKVRRHPSLLPATIALLGVLSLVLSQLSLANHTTAAFYLAPFRIFEFAIGALTIWLMDAKPIARGWQFEAVAAAGLCSVLIPILYFTEATPFPGIAALLPAIGTSMMIYAHRSRLLAWAIGNRGMVAIGLVSYSWYLIHWPMIVFFEYYTFDPLTIGSGHTSTQFSLAVASLGLAALMYKFVEQPFRYVSRSKIRLSGAAFGLVCALLSLIATLPAASTWAGDGWQWRVDERTQRALVSMSKKWGRECIPSERDIRCDFTPSKSERSQRLYLLGDSHAAHFRAGLAYVLKDTNYEALDIGIHSCLPIPDSYWISDGKVGRDPDCERKNKSLWEQVQNADVVVLAGRWAVYTSTHAFGPDSYQRFAQVANGHEHFSTEYSTALVKQGLNAFVERIVQAGKKVIVLGQVPNQGLDIGNCFGRGFLSAFLAERSCHGRPYSEIKGRLTEFDSYLTGLQARYSPNDVLVILPSQLLCSDSRKACRKFLSGRFLYRDHNHLNADGSVILMKQYRQEILTFLDE